MIDELEIWQGKRSRGTQTVFDNEPRRHGHRGGQSEDSSVKWLAIGSWLWCHVGASSGGVTTRASRRRWLGTVQGTVTSLAIVPFYNATGDREPELDGISIADALNSDIGHSAHLHMVSSDRLQQVLHDLGVSPQSSARPLHPAAHCRVYARRHDRLRQVRDVRPADAHQRDRARLQE